MLKLENNFITVLINNIGAEICAIKSPNHGNLIWNKDDQIWNRFAPVLFPIVGRLLDDQYILNGQHYSMKQHGFARDQVFEVLAQDNSSITLRLRDNKHTRIHYPFAFELLIKYTLIQNKVNIEHQVTNLGNENLFFSLGGHPGFHINGRLVEYYLDFGGDYRVNQHLISGNYYNGKTKEINLSRNFQLSDDLFTNDAIVIKQPPFQSIGFGKINGLKILTMHCKDWSALGLWTKPGAPFFCIEPWWGWADSLDSSGKLINKAGIIMLKAGEFSCHSYSIEVH